MAGLLESKLARLSELTDSQEKIAILEDAKIKLANLDSREVESISQNYNPALTALFSQLTSDDREVVEATCNVLKSLFAVLEPGDLYQKHPAEVCQLVLHAEESVRILVLQEILKIAADFQKVPLLLSDISLLVTVANKIGDDSLTVANCAMAIMKEIGKTDSGLQVLYTGELLRAFARLLSKNDTISFRVYEIVVDIAKTSKRGLEASIQSGFLSSLISTLDSNDILLQMNALVVMTQLALTEEGLNFLEDQAVLHKLGQKIAKSDETPLSNLLIPGLMKFFGNVARLWPNEIFSKYPAVVFALFGVIESKDQTILGVALDTLGYVASSVQGKYALQGLGDAMPRVLKSLSEIIQKMPTELRIRGLNSLVLILDVKPEEQDNRILSLTKSWFDVLDNDSLRMIIDLCRQPFADIRQASLEVLAVIASQEWGQEYMSSFPALVEFLLDRNAESFKECKEAKFEVVNRLSKAKSDIFDAATMQKFQEFVSQGPFHVDTITEVALEGPL